MTSAVIAVVDDDEAIRTGVSSLLRSMGFGGLAASVSIRPCKRGESPPIPYSIDDTPGTVLSNQ